MFRVVQVVIVRWLVAREFQRIVESMIRFPDSVAVVGGTLNDPEIQWIRQRFPRAKLTFLGVEEIPNVDFEYFDLNFKQEIERNFDLVHCAQVIEHVWDVKQAVENLLEISSEKGLVWINCPTSCHAHASPHYFSAGYQAELICKLSMSLGASVCDSGQIGSPRSYFYEHTLRRWPDENEYRNPILFMTPGRGGFTRAIFRWLKYLPQRVLAAIYSSKVTQSPDFATQSWVALSKSDQRNLSGRK